MLYSILRFSVNLIIPSASTKSFAKIVFLNWSYLITNSTIFITPDISEILPNVAIQLIETIINPKHTTSVPTTRKKEMLSPKKSHAPIRIKTYVSAKNGAAKVKSTLLKAYSQKNVAVI